MLPLGAINNTTGKYVYPTIATKVDKYSCPDCKKQLIYVKDPNESPILGIGWMRPNLVITTVTQPKVKYIKMPKC